MLALCWIAVKLRAEKVDVEEVNVLDGDPTCVIQDCKLREAIERKFRWRFYGTVASKELLSSRKCFLHMSKLARG